MEKLPQIQAFQYGLAKMMLWYIEDQNLTDISVDKFNKLNSFNKYKAMLLPYLIAAANGHREELTNFWSPFFAYSLGPIPKDLYENPNSFINCTVFVLNNNEIEVKSDTQKTVEQILNMFITNIKCHFESPDNHEYLEYIDSSTRKLKSTMSTGFIALPYIDIIYFFKLYRSYSTTLKLKDKLKKDSESFAEIQTGYLAYDINPIMTPEFF